jgi:very-short-patch-repair endonuclease
MWREELESPIEEILRAALEKKMLEYNLLWYIESQTEIECKNSNIYRADFTIWYDKLVNRELKEDFALVVECDGYEFHQKTKKQVEKDNKREYDLKMNGWEIYRFSGSEIYNEPMECADKIIKYVIEKNNLEIEDK